MPVNSQAKKPNVDQVSMLAWVSLIHLSTHLRGGLEEKLKSELNITLAEQDLMKQLAVNESNLTLTELAKRIYLSKAGMTKMLDRLEKQKLVKRENVPENRRVLRAVLTSKGLTVLDKSQNILLQYVKINFSQHLTKKQMKNFGENLKAILCGLDRWDAQMSHLSGKSSDDQT